MQLAVGRLEAGQFEAAEVELERAIEIRPDSAEARILLALTQKGMSREASYAAVQRNAMDAWRGNASLLALCRADKEIGEFLADDELTALFDMSYHTKQVDTIFKRVFG